MGGHATPVQHVLEGEKLAVTKSRNDAVFNVITASMYVCLPSTGWYPLEDTACSVVFIKHVITK